MKLVELKVKLSEELLETILHFVDENNFAIEGVVFKAIGKTPAYLKAAMNFLAQVNVIEFSGKRIEVAEQFYKVKTDAPNIILKKAIREFQPFQEFTSLVKLGKSEIKAAKYLKASLGIENDPQRIVELLGSYRKYIDSEHAISISNGNDRVLSIDKEAVFWIDSNGVLRYLENECTKQVIDQIEMRRFKNPLFVDQSRINALKATVSTQFDLSKLTKICEEINDAFRTENYFSVCVLIRTIIDHIPPIFGMKSFSEVANNYGSKSFKDVMYNLENFNRKIADNILHTHIKKKEFIPNITSIDCRVGLDLLLSEIINVLN